MKRPAVKTRRLVLTGLGVGIALVAASSLGAIQSSGSISASVAPIIASNAAGSERLSGASLDQMISGLQVRLENAPKDYVSWATLGLAYVQQAKATANPEFYPRADGAFATSLEINKDDNFLAYAGLSALASARHSFDEAKSFAEQGLKINGYSAILYGALSDAQVQLGSYTEAFDSVQKMIDLSPDTASLARASYAWELRGGIAQATQLMQRALDDAPTPGDKAPLFYLGELAFNGGDPETALGYYNSAQAQSPMDPAALAGKAKAEAALGQIDTALGHYAELVARAPEASYVVEYGELLESVGRLEDARRQYDVFRATQQLFAANGVQPDASQTLFVANHGDPQEALRDAELGIRHRPFLAMYDAYAWALHVNGRDQEALDAITKAMELGGRNALYHFHAGMIMKSLGDVDGAKAQLSKALEINPFFSPLAAPLAQAALAELATQTPVSADNLSTDNQEVQP